MPYFAEFESLSRTRNLAKIADCSSRPGNKSSEFKGKSGVQAIMLLVIVLNRFGLNVEIDDETALIIIGGLEAIYALGRSILKSFQSRVIAAENPSQMPPASPVAKSQTAPQPAPADSGAMPHIDTGKVQP